MSKEMWLSSPRKAMSSSLSSSRPDASLKSSRRRVHVDPSRLVRFARDAANRSPERRVYVQRNGRESRRDDHAGDSESSENREDGRRYKEKFKNVFGNEVTDPMVNLSFFGYLRSDTARVFGKESSSRLTIRAVDGVRMVEEGELVIGNEQVAKRRKREEPGRAKWSRLRDLEKERLKILSYYKMRGNEEGRYNWNRYVQHIKKRDEEHVSFLPFYLEEKGELDISREMAEASIRLESLFAQMNSLYGQLKEDYCKTCESMHMR